jgi:prepilin-type N-terminal cleavage/methylation domain-containing protein
VRAQRGFTLIETIVVAAILAVLASAAVISLAQRPGALASAVTGFDASLAAARAIAATSGNGATLVFAARANGSTALPGFTLTVYRGRPTAAGTVTPTTVMAISSDVSVREASLGTPTFAIFLSSAGHASGQSAYPAFGGSGAPTFAPIGSQPPCPSGGFVLSFADAHATQTRILPCRASLASTPSPLSSMAPSAIVLTPKSLTYYWPAAEQQHFVATEWGYTRWFAASEWSCGSGVAAFPASAPAPPYSAAYSPADANAVPLAPSTLPYSFANSPESMEDAPAWFYLTPQAGGLCSVTIGDASAQSASLPVQVMGALTASPTSLSWSDPTQTGAQTVSLGKTYDGEALVGSIGTNSCSGIVTLTWGAVGTPSSPSATPSTQTLNVTPVLNKNGLDVGGGCSFMVISQYPGEPGVTIDVNVRGQMQTWPAAVQYPQPGQALTSYERRRRADVVGTINTLLGGAIADAASAPCPTNYARAFTDAAMSQPDASDATWQTTFGISTDANGCFNPATASMIAFEPSGQSETFSDSASSCQYTLSATGWIPYSATGTQAGLTVIPGSASGTCSVSFSDGSAAPVSKNYGLVVAQVVGNGACSDGMTLSIGASCTFSLPAGQTSLYCESDGSYVTEGGSNTSYAATTTTGGSDGTLASADGMSYTFTRTGTGTVVIAETLTTITPSYNVTRGLATCTIDTSRSNVGSITLN